MMGQPTTSRSGMDADCLGNQKKFGGAASSIMHGCNVTPVKLASCMLQLPLQQSVAIDNSQEIIRALGAEGGFV